MGKPSLVSRQSPQAGNGLVEEGVCRPTAQPNCQPKTARGKRQGSRGRGATVPTLVVAGTVCGPLLQLQGLLGEGGRAPEGELRAPSAPLPTSEGRGGQRLRPQGSPALPAPPTERDRGSSVKNDTHTPGRTRRQSTATGERPT